MSLITITSSALKNLKLLVKKNNVSSILFSVKGGGCNGFEYNFEPIEKISIEKNSITEDGLSVEVCEKSIFYLLGTVLDWKEDNMGKGFSFTNPMAQSSCGCGTSFSPVECADK